MSPVAVPAPLENAFTIEISNCCPCCTMTSSPVTPMLVNPGLLADVCRIDVPPIETLGPNAVPGATGTFVFDTDPSSQCSNTADRVSDPDEALVNQTVQLRTWSPARSRGNVKKMPSADVFSAQPEP